MKNLKEITVHLIHLWIHFVAAIDSCEGLKDIEKFNYLHSYLEVEAFRTIQGIKLTDKNYPEALEVRSIRSTTKKIW